MIGLRAGRHPSRLAARAPQGDGHGGGRDHGRAVRRSAVRRPAAGARYRLVATLPPFASLTATVGTIRSLPTTIAADATVGHKPGEAMFQRIDAVAALAGLFVAT